MRLRTVLAPLVLASALAHAQDPNGDERLRGRVLAADGSPAAGAVVRMQLETGGSPAREVAADADGRFRFGGLAGGTWSISIDFTGHIVSRGRIVLRGERDPLEVRLRSLEEISPAWSEGDVSAISEWIDKGNSLLRDGRYAEARVEYERALGELPWREHAEVLQAIARTFYLEGDRAQAIEHVERALSIEPANEELRRLIEALYESAGRANEARAFLDGLPREPTEPPERAPPDASVEAPAAPAWPERPALEPQPHRTGRFRLRLAERSRLGTLARYAERHGASRAEIREHDPLACDYAIEDESFEVYVPESYDPGLSYGLLVWVSPTPFGGTERPEIWRLLDERRVLWIGANRSGNERSRWDRTALALDAAETMRGLYPIDPARVWVGGYSGGGRVAGGLALLYSEVFRGGLFVMGCDFYRNMPVSSVPGATWPASFRPPPGLPELRKEHRFVILTGSRDFNLSRCRSVHEAFVDEEFRHVSFLEVPGMSHYDPVPAEWWDRALRFLDGSAAP